MLSRLVCFLKHRSPRQQGGGIPRAHFHLARGKRAIPSARAAARQPHSPRDTPVQAQAQATSRPSTTGVNNPARGRFTGSSSANSTGRGRSLHRNSSAPPPSRPPKLCSRSSPTSSKESQQAASSQGRHRAQGIPRRGRAPSFLAGRGPQVRADTCTGPSLSRRRTFTSSWGGWACSSRRKAYAPSDRGRRRPPHVPGTKASRPSRERSRPLTAHRPKGSRSRKRSPSRTDNSTSGELLHIDPHQKVVVGVLHPHVDNVLLQLLEHIHNGPQVQLAQIDALGLHALGGGGG